MNMQTDNLVIGRKESITKSAFSAIELYDKQVDIVSRILEKYDGKKIDFVHISAYSPMGVQEMHTYDVDSKPPRDRTKIKEYLQRFFDHTNFVGPLIYYGLLSSMYHINPRFEEIAAYKENRGWSVSTRTLDADYIPFNAGCRMVYTNYFDDVILSPRYKFRSMKKLLSNINQNQIPLVVSINLDALQYTDRVMKKDVEEKRMKIWAGVMTNPLRNAQANWNGERNYQHYSSEPLLEQLTADDFNFFDEICSPEEKNKRIARVNNFFKGVRKPELVMITRSQKPIPSCPPSQCGELEQCILECL